MAADLKHAAATWANRGWRVFPCLPTKQPATPHGFKDASSDKAQLEAWEWPMIGGVPGSAGYVVLDVDVQGGASLTDLPIEALETRRHKTKSGGWHLIFKAREGAVYGNGPRPDIAAGVDIRHNDGYVILPPSAGYRLEHDAEPAEAPAWLEHVGQAAQTSAPAVGGQIPRGQQDHELRAIANRAYQLGLDEKSVRDVVRHTIEARCQDQDPANPWTEHDIERLARPVPDTLTAAINRGEIDNRAEPDYMQRERRGLRLLTTSELADLPPVEFLLDDLLVSRGFNVLAGPSGGGKSFLAIDMAAKVADAGGNVVYVMAEGSGGAYRRAAAWAAHHNKPLPDIRWLVQSFDVLVDTPELLELAGPCDLLIFDTLHRITPGLDENSAQEMGRVIQAVDHMRETAGAASLLVHHTGWDDSRERGSSSLRGAADVFLRLRPNKEGDGVIDLTCLKMKEAEQWATRHYRIEPAGDDAAAIFGTAPSAVIVPSLAPAEVGSLERETRIIAYLEREPHSSGNDIERAVGGDVKAVRSTLKDLETRGLLASRDLGRGRGKLWVVAPDE